jgi:hypothetical protein
MDRPGQGASARGREGASHGRFYVLGLGPGFARQQGEETAASGQDGAPVHQHAELTLVGDGLQLRRDAEGLDEVGGVTRRPGLEASGMAVLDADVHDARMLPRRGADGPRTIGRTRGAHDGRVG